MQRCVLGRTSSIFVHILPLDKNTIYITVFWNVMCSLADRYQHFVWTCCLHHYDCKANGSHSSEMLVPVYKTLQHHIPEILATVYKILHFRRLSYLSHCENLKLQTFSLQFPFCHPTSLIICIYCLMPLTVLMDKLCSFCFSPLAHSCSLVEHLPLNFVLEINIILNFVLELHLPIMWDTCFKNTYKNWQNYTLLFCSVLDRQQEDNIFWTAASNML